jgi:hypothetical protein
MRYVLNTNRLRRIQLPVLQLSETTTGDMMQKFAAELSTIFGSSLARFTLVESPDNVPNVLRPTPESGH